MNAIAYYFRLSLAALPIAVLLLIQGFAVSVVVGWPLWAVFTSGVGTIGSCFDPFLIRIYLGCATLSGVLGYGIAFGEIRRYVGLLARDEPPQVALRRIFYSLLLRRFLVLLPWALGVFVVPGFRFPECLWFLLAGGVVYAVLPHPNRLPLRGDAERLAARNLQRKADHRAMETATTVRQKQPAVPRAAVRGVAVEDTHAKRGEEIILR